ncbi:RagB/SusD family nutrient uptake outer membrane protein [Segetibacter koreensis]|uniref:RagB/SusD family nutrient uptake outer membrane protein n=1 Tax=Segetibacter koreensis TaxID=398037 RepID=UPI000380DCD1|nr:RagB/SusD family nutrient uptake outer membrane protein [Segetibacter koreensis]
MKRRNIACFCILFLIPGISCRKMLDEKIVSGITDGYLDTKPGFYGGLNAAYSDCRNFYGSEKGLEMTELGTDIFTNASDGDFKYFNLYNSQLDPNELWITSLWNNSYHTINTINAVLRHADAVPDLTPEEKTKALAEARWLRAYNYFILVQTYGPVVLTLQETTSISYEATRAPIKDVYASIVEDLDFAITNLPAEQSDYGRATKPAAEHLLAKVLLTRAYTDAAEPDDFSHAATLAENVINNYNFKLLDNFADVFQQGEGEKNSEVIWSVQYTDNKLNSVNNDQTAIDWGFETGNSLHLFFVMQYDILPGMKRDVANGRPYRELRPTMFGLDNFYNRSIDSRYDKSFQTVWYCNNEESIPKDADGNPKFNLGDTAVWMPGTELNVTKRYMVVKPSQYTETLFPVLTKFLDKNRPTRTETSGSRDYIAFRLADTYLTASEALLGAGRPDEALQKLNKVRERAAYPGLESQMDYDKINIDTILNERGRELAGESMRFFDLTRTGRLVERVRKYNPQAAPLIQDYHVLRPIPQSQINLTSTPFEQNPGYPK